MNKMEIVEEILEDPACIYISLEPTKINPPDVFRKRRFGI